MSHRCPIKYVEIGKGALDKLPEITEGYKSILLVCDENTIGAYGNSVFEKIGEKISTRVTFSGKSLLVPDEQAILEVEKEITEKTDLIVGVGSGVINDICKHVSHKNGLRYHIIATAPSMDGYASRGAALILGGMKVTLNADVPEAIVADGDVLANAPMQMILAGYGDIIGKYSCLNDWRLSALVNNEYICEYVLSETYSAVEQTRALASKMVLRDPDAISELMNALVAVGILMAYVGNSRPASGSEHHFSHYFEIVGIEKGEEYYPHGIDVFYSAAETAKIRDMVISAILLDDLSPKFDRAVYEENIKRIYGSVADEVMALQDKLGWYNSISDRIEVYKSKRNEICEVLKTAPTFTEMCEILSEVGMSYSDFRSFYGEEKINDAYLYAKDLKDRYSVLWMYSDIFGIK